MIIRDTVASTGVIMSRTLPFTTNNASIKTFRHALSLDEHRAKFVPTFYHRKAPTPESDQNDPEHTTTGLVPTPKLAAGADAKATKATADNGDTSAVAKQLDTSPNGKGVNGNATETHQLRTQKNKVKSESKKVWSVFSKGKKEEIEGEDNDEACLDVKEVWFAGCHSGDRCLAHYKNKHSLKTNHRCRWRRG